jgi:chorismate-pyruvate lyase
VIISRRSTPELEALARLYYESVDDLGRFEEVGEKDMPPAYRGLLAHDEHMTEALEAFHACDLAVQVLESAVNETHYRRKVILTRKRDDAVVLFGIVRVTRALLPPEIRDAIEAERIPLGRILIRSELLRRVRLLSLWKVEPGDDLCRIFGFAKPETCYGRTALMYCDTVPVIELLEVVTAS